MAPNFEGFGSVADIFSAFFGGGGFESAFGAAAAAARGAQGADVGVAVGIELAEAARGTSAEVEYEVGALRDLPRQRRAAGHADRHLPPLRRLGQLQAVTRTALGQIVRTAVCDQCGGDGRVPEQPAGRAAARAGAERRTLRVDVPAGIADGQRIRLAGRGHAGERGGPAGDLYVMVRVHEDERFVRDGEDLHTMVDVSAPLAALGTTVQVPTLGGESRWRSRPAPSRARSSGSAGAAAAAAARAHGRPPRARQRRRSRAGSAASSATCSSASPTR